MLTYLIGALVTGIAFLVAIIDDGVDPLDWITAFLIIVFAAAWPVTWVFVVAYAIDRGGKRK